MRAVDWALSYLDSYIRFKAHLDLDSKVCVALSSPRELRHSGCPAVMEAKLSFLSEFFVAEENAVQFDEGRVGYVRSLVSKSGFVS